MKDKEFRTTFTRATIFRSARVALLATLAYAAVILGVYMLGTNVLWQPSPLYDFLWVVKDTVNIWVPAGWLLMMLVIIYRSWSRLTGFIEEIAAASISLVQPDDYDIRLPQELQDIERRLNQIKHAARQNEREARLAEQRKNDLVVNLAHDIRTPLASVIGYLSLLSEAPDMPCEQRAKYTGITLDKAYRLEQLINEFFEITRYNLNTIVLNRANVNLAFMLRQMADEFYPMLHPQGKQVQVIAPEELFLWGDADKLARVFNNILKNAASYSYPNSVIRMEAQHEGEHTVIRFTNAGDPIPPHQLETIFERFFRLDGARSSSTGGAGLGLAIAKEIAVAHGGAISASSEGEETVFTVILPTGGDAVHAAPTVRETEPFPS